MLESPLFKRILLATILICSLSFFDLAVITARGRNIIEFLGIGLIIFIIIADVFSESKFPIKQHYKVEIILFLLATFFSMLMAEAIHGQSLKITMIAQRFMYFYFLYFFLHSLRISGRDIERLLLIFALLYVGAYIVQFLAYPALIFDAKMAGARGTVRILLPGSAFAILAYFKSLQNFLLTHKIKHALLGLLFFTVLGVLLGSRQVTAGLVFTTAIFVFFNKQVKSRTAIILLMAAGAVSVYLLFQDIFTEMMAVSEVQASDKNTNIRIVAMRYFVTDFMTSNWAYIFGNGQDSLFSSYGSKVFGLKRVFGLHQADVGIVGEYSKFGILYVIAQLSIILRIVFGKLPKQLNYIRYYVVVVSIKILSSQTDFTTSYGIAFIMLILYLIDYYKSDKLKIEELSH